MKNWDLGLQIKTFALKSINALYSEEIKKSQVHFFFKFNENKTFSLK